jgi:hypothetical protein
MQPRSRWLHRSDGVNHAAMGNWTSHKRAMTIWSLGTAAPAIARMSSPAVGGGGVKAIARTGATAGPDPSTDEAARWDNTICPDGSVASGTGGLLCDFPPP